MSQHLGDTTNTSVLSYDARPISASLRTAPTQAWVDEHAAPHRDIAKPPTATSLLSRVDVHDLERECCECCDSDFP